MKKSLTHALGFCAALLLAVTACKKDEVQAVLQPGPAPALTASASSFVLTQASAAPVPTQMDVRVVASVGATAPVVASPAATFTATPYSFCEQPAQAWGLIGPAGKGWNDGDDITLTYSCTSKTYSYTGPLKADKFKFRFNKAWDANLGGASSTGGALTQGGPDMTISAAGTYTVTLSATIDASGKASGTYTIK